VPLELKVLIASSQTLKCKYLHPSFYPGFAVAGLAAQGHNVRALVRSPSAPSAQKIKSQYGANVELVEATLEDLESLKKAFNGADVVRRLMTFDP